MLSAELTAKPSSPELKTKFFIPAALFLIAAITWGLFSPSLSLPFRDGDQIGYFAELHGSTSLRDGFRLLDYGLSRIYAKGDEVLYRPLTFAWLAIQNHFFAYHVFYWNTVNLLLHLVNAIVFFFLLNQIQPGIFALLTTLMAATFPSSLPLVTNHHLGGYLAGFGFYFAGLVFYCRMVRSLPRIAWKEWLAYSILTTIACFFYEIAVPFSGVALLFILPALSRDKIGKQLLVLVTPILLYTFFYFMRDFSKTERLFYVDDWRAGSIIEGRKISETWYYIYVMFYDFVTFVVKCPRYLKILSGAVFLVLIYPSITLKHSTLLNKMRFFPVCLILTYLVFLSFMRTGIFRDYYPYLFYFFVFLSFHSIFDFTRLNALRRNVLIGALLGAIGFNIYSVWKDSHTDLAFYKPLASYMNRLENFVDSQRQQPGFSFAIENLDPELDIWFDLVEGYPDEVKPFVRKCASEIIFAPFYNKNNPQFILHWDSKTSAFQIRRNL